MQPDEGADRYASEAGQDKSPRTITGKIYRVVADHGYSWARTEQGIDYFVHRSELRNAKFEDLTVGVGVEFVPTNTAKGPRAVEVYVL